MRKFKKGDKVIWLNGDFWGWRKEQIFEVIEGNWRGHKGAPYCSLGIPEEFRTHFYNDLEIPAIELQLHIDPLEILKKVIFHEKTGS